MNLIIGRFLPPHAGHDDLLTQTIRYAFNRKTTGSNALVTVLVVGTPVDVPSLKLRVALMREKLMTLGWTEDHHYRVEGLEIPLTLEDSEEVRVKVTRSALDKYCASHKVTNVFHASEFSKQPRVAGVDISHLPVKYIMPAGDRVRNIRENWWTVNSKRVQVGMLREFFTEFAVHSFAPIRAELSRQSNRLAMDRGIGNINSIGMLELVLSDQIKPDLVLRDELRALFLQSGGYGNRANWTLLAPYVVNFASPELILAANPSHQDLFQDILRETVFRKMDYQYRQKHIVIVPSDPGYELSPDQVSAQIETYKRLTDALNKAGTPFQLIGGTSTNEVRRTILSLIKLDAASKFVSALPGLT